MRSDVSNRGGNILLAAGGTGGHLFPALAIAEEIRKKEPNANVLFVGTKDKIEARIVPQRKFAFTTIWISGFHRRQRIQNLIFPIKVVVSIAQSFFLINRFRPDVVVGTGGYVCGPVLLVASLLRIPTIIHESNSYPGITTRLLSGRATKVFTAFAVTNRWLKRTDNVELVGTPTIESLDKVSKESGIQSFGLDAQKQTVLVFGGSLGASSVNRAIMQFVDDFIGHGIQLIWQTGESDYTAVKEATVGKKVGWVGAFIDRMDCAYAAADIVVSRSGATTIAELTRIGKPAVLVPYPFAAADHQTLNARTIVEVGAAEMVADEDVNTALEKKVFDLLNDRRRMATMSKASKILGHPNAGKIIAERILRFVIS
jgi:UDP-N-acetylglucosamine--N-acetylmuramyl-(pentapeptide) pyrophosphoryl-undecaprenol N-acetylglucosamine transferase